MPKFLIEREIPGAGAWSEKQLREVSQHSVEVLGQLGHQVQWVQSYVTGDKVYCVYIAPNEELIREHARIAGFPADRISEIRSLIDPTTAER
ncbi:MAG TPA: DUF4242 domain-containing protein [Dehalococcoidia bacterium]|nr:DUF4242 domain-containing protein [Dehalococcoidia bacterium]